MKRQTFKCLSIPTTLWKYLKIINWTFLFLILCAAFALAQEEPQPAVALGTQPIELKQPAMVEMGVVTITTLTTDAISSADILSLQIPGDFPGVWDTSVSTLSLSADSSSGLINEAVVYPDGKTLNIVATGNWPVNSKISISNLKINIPEFPSYEQIFSGSVVNLGCISLVVSGSGEKYTADNSILLKVSPLYAGDDGWSQAGSPDAGAVAGYKFANLVSTYSTNTDHCLAGRGFQAVVYAVDSDDNWVTATDTVVMSSVLAADTSTSGNALFYTSNTYATTATTYTLADGWSYVYVKDDTIEAIEIKATKQSDSNIFGTSANTVGFDCDVNGYFYTITTASSPQTVGVGWSAQIVVKDAAAGNTITDAPPTSVTLTSDGNAYFYPDADFTPAEAVTTLSYDLTSGSCAIYVEDDVAENVTLSVNDTYSSLNNSAGGSSSMLVTVATWGVRMDFAYDEAEGSADDTLTIRAWLEQEGNLVNDADLGQATLRIYDASTLQETLTDTSADSGVYWFSWEDTELATGRSYFAQLSIVHGSSTHVGGEDFYLTMDKELDALITSSTSATQTLQATAAGISDEVTDEISPQLAATKADTAKAVTATETTLPAQITSTKNELEPHIYASILNAETQIASGGELVIRYRAPSGTTPTLDLYDPDETSLLDDVAMTAVGTTGVYEYTVDFLSSWGKGFFTVICSESTYGTLDGVTVNVTDADLASVARDVSAVLGSTSDLQNLSGIKGIIDTAFADIANKLALMKEHIVTTIASDMGARIQTIAATQVESIYEAMDTVSDQMQGLGLSAGGDIENLYEVSRASSEDLTYVRNKFIELDNLLMINKKMMDSITYEPIVQIWYEFRQQLSINKKGAKKMEKNKKFGFLNLIILTFCMFILSVAAGLFFTPVAQASIILKAVVVNPSPDTEKEVELKIPLPKEIRPEHVLNAGDMELDFDAQKSVYYAHKKFMLAPKDSIVREIEVIDVWQIDANELSLIRDTADKLWAVCKNSEYEAQVSFLKNNIDSKLNQILQSQKSLPMTPQEHISNYRKNLERLEEIKADLDNLAKVVSKIKPVSGKAIGQLIIFVLLFLALVAVVFIFTWQKYLKSPKLEKLESPEETNEEEKIQRMILIKFFNFSALVFARVINASLYLCYSSL